PRRTHEIERVELEGAPVLLETRADPPREVEVHEDPWRRAADGDEEERDQPPHLAAPDGVHVEHDARQDLGARQGEHPDERHPAHDQYDEVRDRVAADLPLEAREEAVHPGPSELAWAHARRLRRDAVR